MQFKDIPSLPGYKAGSDGSIKGRSGRIIKLADQNGYLTFWIPIRPGKAYAHVAVCEAFHGPRPAGHEVAHGNGVRSDNKPENLRWSTRADNHFDKREHGTHIEGEQISWAKLTEEKVREIKKLDHLSTVKVGKMFGVSPAAIWLIRSGRNWKHVS